MNRRIRLLPIVLAIGAIAWFYFSSPTFINPETGRKSKVGLSESQEQTLGLQTFSRSCPNRKQFNPAQSMISSLR
jgi:hypothetical protein